MFEKSKLKKALKDNDVATMRQLLTAKRHLMWKEINYRIPFYHAVRDGHDDMAIMLIEEFNFKPGQRYEGYTNAFFQMACHGRLDLFKRYQENYATVIMQDRQSYSDLSLLHSAASHGQLEFVKHLVAIGFDVLLKDGAGKTARYRAEESNQAAVVEFIKEVEAAKKKPSPAPVAPTKPAVTGIMGWQKLDAQRIARISEEKAIGYRFIEIFNFAAGDMTRISHNLSTKAESSAVVRVSFDNADCREAAARLGIPFASKTLPIGAKHPIAS